MRKRAVLIAIAVVLVLAGVIVARAQSILAALAPRIISMATGYDVTFGDERFERGHAAFLHVHVSRDGEPVLDAARVDVSYSLRDLLPGSRHRYGVTAIAIDHPSLTLVRHKDGSYNVIFPQSQPAPIAAPQPPNRVPIALTVRIRNGSGVVRAPYTYDADSRTIGVTNIKLDADINSLARTHYTLAGAFVEKPALEPFSVVGTVDVERGYAMHHAFAKAVPMRAIANYFINSSAAHILAGTAHDLDIKAYALDVQRYVPITYHLSGYLDVADAQMQIVSLAQPLAHIAGTLQLVDDTFFFDRLHATLDGLPVGVSGGIYRFSDPQYRLGINATGDLSALRKTFAFSSNQPVDGLAHVNVLVQGDLAAPVVLAKLDAPHATYRALPLDDVHAKIAYQGGHVMIAPLQATVHGASLAIRGMLTLGQPLRTQLGLTVRGPASTLPYIGTMLGDEPLVADALLDGRDMNFSGFGALQSERGIDRTAAVIRVARDGIVDLDPFWIATPHGEIAGAYHLNRRTDASAFWLDGHAVALQPLSSATGFGDMLPSLPPLAGTIDDVAIEGGGRSGTHAIVGGSIDAHALKIAGVPIDLLRARFAGSLGDAAVSPVVARGPWGSIDGAGALALNALAVRGTYHGTLQGLRPYLNDPTASGRVDGPAALAISPGRITIQAGDLALHDARVHGLPVDRVRGTLAMENGTLRVYSAQGQLAGGSIVAAGTYQHGIALVANNVRARDLHAIGIPLDAGTLSASGRLTQGRVLPDFTGGVAVANGRVQQYAVAGSGLIDLRNETARVDHAVGSLDGTYALLNGNLSQLTSGAPAYDLHADVPAGDVTRALETLQLPTLASDGTYNAQLNVRGRGLDPSVTGPIDVVAGSVNGLAFTDGHALIDATRVGVIARHGSVQVASTHLNFAAAERPRISGVLVRAPKADLEDFNNFFDTGDTLDGSGSLRFDVVSQLHRISSNGAIDVKGFRYRNLAIGDTRASWSSAHNLLKGSLSVGGAQGLLRARGSIAFAPSPQWLDVARNSTYNVTVDLDNLDTSTWLAAFGFAQIPFTGRLDADATIAGRYPRLAVNATSSLTGGTIGPLPIDAADFAFSSIGNRIRVDSGSVVAPGITATASGSFGLAPADNLALDVYLNSNDVPRLVSQIWRVDVPVSGEFESTVSARGTNAKPKLTAAFDANNAVVYGVHIPSIFGSLQWNRTSKTVELSNAGAQFEHGSISLAGSLPLQLRPFGVGPANAPVSLDLAVSGLDPAAFQSLLGHNTQLGGVIDGQVALAGSAGSPRIYGRFSLAKGSYVSDLERTPISNAAMALTFDRTQATVEHLSANLGSGSIDASGHVAFGAASTGPTYQVAAQAKDAQLNVPGLGSGALDGNLTLARTAAQRLARLGGGLTLHDAVIPFSAFLAATQNQSGAGGGGLPLNLRFDLALDAGKNVRVRGSGYGAGLDLGATGGVQLAGTLTNPTLDGSFASAGGTLTYFDRAFRVQNASVTFSPDNGIIPNLEATGITHVSNADPRTGGYSTDVTINVSGPINSLKIAFSSNPPGYSNEQILAMIAPFGGLIGNTAYSGSNATINGVQQYGALSVVPGAQPVTGTPGSVTAGQEAFNILNAQFTAGVLAPFENAISQGLGFSDISLNVDYYGNVGFSATRLLGRTVNFIYSQTFGIPSRYSAGLELVGSGSTSAQLSFYWTTGPQLLFKTPNGISSSSRLAIGQPLQGDSGFAFTLQRLYW
ncbi:MAG TPA: translocation/assembly module TamB domain-containing protein [Candidatus Aquilonibacter sp.]|nr:translocation/assembly module TamB domain-containing protein [Candidatus Aquilonibacter sp.]